MTGKSIKVDKSKNFDEKGHFAKGNQIGRMPQKGVTLKDLTELVIEYEKAQGKGKDALLKHYVNRLFKNDLLLARFMDKYIPTKTISELSGLGGEPIRYIIEKTYEKPEKPKIEETQEGTGDVGTKELQGL